MQDEEGLQPQDYIRAWRKFKNMTQDDLAAKVGLSTPGISMIENGKQGVTLAKLAQIAEAFGITLPELLAPPPSGDAAQETALKREIVEIFDQLPGNLQAVYLAQARALLSGAQAAEPVPAEKKSNH